jgi:hypothetical protein
LDVTCLLIEACPEAAAVQAFRGTTPFDYFLNFRWPREDKYVQREVPLAKFEACVRAFIWAYETTGTMERFIDTFSDPLYAAAKSWPLSLVKMIDESFPRSALQEQSTNILTASASNAHDDVFAYLSPKYPDATRFPLSSHGETPCLAAVRSSHFHGAMRIFRLDPTAAAIPDARGYTPLFSLIVSRDNAALFVPAWAPRHFPKFVQYYKDHDESERRVAEVLNLFYMLLKAAPQVVRFVTNVEQKTVLDVARERSIPFPLRRALHCAAPDLYPDEYRMLIYEARRVALYLLHLPLSTLASLGVDDVFRVWRRLRESGMSDMIMKIVSYL